MKPSPVLILIAFLLVGALSCGADEEPVYLLTPDATAGPHGVAVLERTFRVRVDDTVSTRLYFPTTSDGDLLAGPLPVALFIQGGAVSPDQYSWLSTHLASQGYLVAAPDHFANLAIFSIGNGPDLIDALDRAHLRSGDLLKGRVSPDPALVLGHSLGGVIAIKAWLDQPTRFNQLILLQSQPDPADTDRLASRSFDPGQVFAIGASRDERITPETIHADLNLFRDDVPLAIIDGLNHFQLVEGATPTQSALDGAASIDTATGRDRLLSLLDLVLTFHQDPASIDLFDSALWPDGVLTFDEYRAAP